MDKAIGTHRKFKNPTLRKLARLVCRFTHKKHWTESDSYGRDRRCTKCGRKWQRRFR